MQDTNTMTINQECRICHSKQLKKFLVLGDQPPANRFIKKEELGLDEPHYPLDVYWCENCNLAQLIHVVDKEELFKNYIYFSSGMPKLSDHFKKYAENIIQKLKPNDLVVEIASNDGVLLKFFKEAGFRVLGVDPAENIAPLAESLGVPTINDFFSESLAKKIVQSQGKAKAVLANNVVAHINDHHDLAKGIKILIEEDGMFVLEAPYLVDMFENLSFDTIYHEHLSLLAIRPLQILFDQFDLEVFDVELHPVQGQSIRVFVGHKGKHPISPNVFQFVNKEIELKLNTFEAYTRLAKRIENSKDSLVKILKNLKVDGKKIAAYGAPAKGNTLLNYAKIGNDLLDFALEDLPSKQNLYTPGMHIPVVDRQYNENNTPDYYLLLAWNYYKPILEKEKKFIENGGKFILPIGDEIKII